MNVLSRAMALLSTGTMDSFVIAFFVTVGIAIAIVVVLKIVRLVRKKKGKREEFNLP